MSPGGIPKRAVAEAFATPAGLHGDSQAHPNIHGGPDQALLLISAEVIDGLREQGWPLFYGALGENLTISGIDFRQIRLGQRFAVGDTVVEIRKLRQPCAQLRCYGPGIEEAIFDSACRQLDSRSPRWGWSGFYARVHRGGWIRVGAPVRLLDAAV